jgi:hypothetical protein
VLHRASNAEARGRGEDEVRGFHRGAAGYEINRPRSFL